ncbi:conserved protein of unknown function [Acidithiobacillus ferrivorans]|uniref:Nucleoside 2-deoxyribosyltransferase n=1 Tax=Acidithiobacillus ferrivorans TaxID=160808 RepID=A0A060URJ5_9PROT|nr:hypothetical protein [Acidithiobacillus ferrivorans]CDQ09413.1 conserved hypothetical protein [Acidithiobacillus ferrivorans]SMH66347.1 conserved protein of unknown function [Acidithiobacillus ferrivorans]
MFNLIVKASGWAEGFDTFPGGRVFEYTEQLLVDRFKPDGQLDLAALITFPTVFVQETYGQGDQIARIGTIIRARMSGRDVVLEYVYDPGVPPIPNRHFQSFAAELGIADFQFSRTHWSVKSADLFRSLLRNLQPRRSRPTVFQIADPEAIERTLVSAMMPFHPSFTPVYETLQRTAQTVGLRCRRADDIWENPAVIQDVVSLIDRSRVVICDCSTRNPNVFYEIGIAHALGREVILITQSAEDIPFDLRHLRYVQYLNNGEGLAQLAARLLPRLETLA